MLAARHAQTAALDYALTDLHAPAMTTPPFVDDLAQRFKDMMSQNPAADIEKNFKLVVQGALTRMDIVTRDEFDRQREVLAKTREKLDMLEEKVTAMEARK
jgi:ubiquinone biosynthesis accessory factor UbiK